jgi:hypothetical protein
MPRQGRRDTWQHHREPAKSDARKRCDRHFVISFHNFLWWETLAPLEAFVFLFQRTTAPLSFILASGLELSLAQNFVKPLMPGRLQ